VSYAQRKHTTTKRERAILNSRWSSRPRDAGSKIDQAQRDCWDALHALVSGGGGAIVSVRFAELVRLEVPLDSGIPARLVQLGFDPVFIERTTRIGPPVSGQRGRFGDFNSSYSFHVCDIFELRLPKE
jgi:hypothetical protein